jgi:hypothetical protein
MNPKRRRIGIREVAEKYMQAMAHSRVYLSTDEIVGHLMETRVEVLNPQSFRTLISTRVRPMLMERTEDGDRLWYPVRMLGVERWVPREHMDAGRMRNFLVNTDRPTLANHARANRRREIELVIMENEERLVASPLTVGDIAPLADQALSWL